MAIWKLVVCSSAGFGGCSRTGRQYKSALMRKPTNAPQIWAVFCDIEAGWPILPVVMRQEISFLPGKI